MLVEYIEPTMTIKYTNSLFWTKETPFLTTDAATFVKRLENKKPTYEVTRNRDDVCRVYFDIDYKCDDEKNTFHD